MTLSCREERVGARLCSHGGTLGCRFFLRLLLDRFMFLLRLGPPTSFLP